MDNETSPSKPPPETGPEPEHPPPETAQETAPAGIVDDAEQRQPPPLRPSGPPAIRELHDHRTGVLGEKLRVFVLDQPGPGGANHEYIIRLSGPDGGGLSDFPDCYIRFQKGAIGDVGLNGISNESLLGVVIDRLRGFQRGPFYCVDNAEALTHIEAGLRRLLDRTRDRINRGVEGKNLR